MWLLDCNHVDNDGLLAWSMTAFALSDSIVGWWGCGAYRRENEVIRSLCGIVIGKALVY